jgi:hypothetical protein
MWRRLMASWVASIADSLNMHELIANYATLINTSPIVSIYLILFTNY